MKILLADDNAANRMIARSILEREGHEVTGAINGEDAVKKARKIEPELVLLDILMPVMDGVRAHTHMRQFLDDSVIIALTSYSKPGDVARYLRAGFDGLIAKPLQPGDLETVLTRLGRGSRAVLRKADSCVDDAQALPLLNMRVLAEGPGSAGPELAGRILARYRKSVWDAILDLNASLPGCLDAEAENIARFRDALHRLKGASDMIGLARAPYLAGQLRNAPPTELRRGVRTLLEALQESLPALHEVLLQTPKPGAALFTLGQGRGLVEVGGQHQPEATHHDQDHRPAI